LGASPNDGFSSNARPGRLESIFGIKDQVAAASLRQVQVIATP
jgi:hypothetical protein